MPIITHCYREGHQVSVVITEVGTISGTSWLAIRTFEHKMCPAYIERVSEERAQEIIEKHHLDRSIKLWEKDIKDVL